MSLFGNGCGLGGGDSWIWILIILCLIFCCCGENDSCGSSNSGCCDSCC